MPELAEVEFYRKAMDPVLGSRIVAVHVHDPNFVRGGESGSLSEVLAGAQVLRAHRHGKVLLVQTDAVDLGLRFGMTGRLVVDGRGPIDELLWSPVGDEQRWCRLTIDLDGHLVQVFDPRRFGSVELDPDLSGLGPDALDVSGDDLGNALAGSAVAIKARLLDQSRIAGVGNLAADEILWEARLDPRRASASMSEQEVIALARSVREVLARLVVDGGSHTGELAAVRLEGGPCPRCGGGLRRDKLGGRTTWWCEACVVPPSGGALH